MNDLHIFAVNNHGSFAIRFSDKKTGEVYAIDTYGLLQFLEEKFCAKDFKSIPIARKYRKMTEEQTYNHLQGVKNA